MAAFKSKATVLKCRSGPPNLLVHTTNRAGPEQLPITIRIQSTYWQYAALPVMEFQDQGYKIKKIFA